MAEPDPETDGSSPQAPSQRTPRPGSTPSVADVYLTGRQAADALAAVGLCRSQARKVLAAGLAGTPTVAGSAHLYLEEDVRELVSRPHVMPEGLDALGTSILFLARRQVDVRAPRDAQLATVGRGWDLGPPISLLLRAKVRLEGFVPFVATVAGFVALGAEITDVRRDGPRYHILLADPGDWFESFRGRRLSVGPGRDFLLHGWKPTRDRSRDRSRSRTRDAAMGGSSHPTPEENA